MANSSASQATKENQPTEATAELGQDEPESEFPASDLFCQQMYTMVCSQDVLNVKRNQQHALHRFEKTNEMFHRFNELSAVRFEVMQGIFRQHTKLLVEMKNDLETVFRRIRNLKSKLSQQYPEAFEATQKGIKTLEDELEDNQNTAPEEDDKQEFVSLGDIFVNKSTDVEETGAEVSEGSTGSSTKLDDSNNIQTVEVCQGVDSGENVHEGQSKFPVRELTLNNADSSHGNLHPSQPCMAEIQGPSLQPDNSDLQHFDESSSNTNHTFCSSSDSNSDKDTVQDFDKKSIDCSLEPQSEISDVIASSIADRDGDIKNRSLTDQDLSSKTAKDATELNSNLEGIDNRRNENVADSKVEAFQESLDDIEVPSTTEEKESDCVESAAKADSGCDHDEGNCECEEKQILQDN